MINKKKKKKNGRRKIKPKNRKNKQKAAISRRLMWLAHVHDTRSQQMPAACLHVLARVATRLWPRLYPCVLVTELLA